MKKTIQLLLLLSIFCANGKTFAQETVISGVVVDKTGVPLPGVSVYLKGTSTGVMTDFEGSFNLTVSDRNLVEGDSIMVFSFIGFEQQEILFSGQNFIEVTLVDDVQSLDEVMVVGYGTQKKANLTGAVSQIEAEAIEDRPVTNISNAIQGLLPGVTITGASGVPGNNGGTIRVRGIGTWGNASPLVVIDGIPGGNLDILNPNDIESISVLKDAASSSIYGVRGANGVILVTTKKGSGETTFSYSGYYGIQKPTALPNFVDSATYMELLNESMINAGRNPTYTSEDIEIARSGSDPNYFANTDWIEEIYKDYAPQQNHNISINGGKETFNYYLSYGLLKEGGLITGDNFKANRHNIRVKLNTTLMDKLDIDGNLGYIERDYAGSSGGTSVISAAHSILPLVPVRFTTGGWGYLGGQRNPVAIATDGGSNDFASQELTGNVSATLRLFDGFSLKGQYGIIRSNSKRTIFSRTVNYYSPEDGSLIYRNNYPNKIDTRDYTSIYQTIIATAQYQKIFNEVHDTNFLLGASQEETIGDNFAATRTNLASQEIGHINLGTEDQLNSGSAYQNALQSLFGRVNYAFNNKYLAEANFRYDGSTRFAKDVRWELFSSASLGWIFTNEKFFEGINDILEFGKIRASYGTQGNDQIGDWAYLDILGPVGTMPIGYENTIGYRQVVVANEILTWESAIKKNLGLDLAFFNNRLQLTADYFINETENILLTLPLPDVFGAPYPVQNAGKIENKGWEFQVNWNDNLGDLSYGANFNISDVRNRVVDLGGTDPTVGDRIRMVGEPLDAFYGLVADRLAQENDFSFNPNNSSFEADFPHISSDPVAPGDIIYKDINGDGEITLEGDRKVIGSHIPRYTYGFRGDLGFKGFDFQFFLQGVGKVNGYLYGSARHALISESSFPQEVHLDRWTPENTDASYPRLSYQQTYNQRLSTYWLEDASYLRLKNVQIGYTLPSPLTKKLRINKLRFYASGDNLWTKTNFFYGYDPESPVSDGDFYPQVKTLVFGMNVNFN
ncbi:TonB-dependent receptor [Gramella sp. AN32]|uniref:SusC/RagA family TonB-linked outer membrane protein n=1 Tax=Christiangramia antarctica TaxID=2058158 RepID=A0ABW5X1X3_9FLAO|nr:TonB-dependent receptor [Gramella sp. AN32]MCM4155751.1 SusC/RagA family TonB-linked outer membrane protein [Gramella sp. AN32]